MRSFSKKKVIRIAILAVIVILIWLAYMFDLLGNNISKPLVWSLSLVSGYLIASMPNTLDTEDGSGTGNDAGEDAASES